MAANLSIAERAYFVRKLGGTNDGKPLNQVKREYYVKFTGAAATNVPFNELELRWILKVLGDASITPSNPNSSADLWKQMASAAGVPAARNIDQNKMLFYLNAA